DAFTVSRGRGAGCSPINGRHGKPTSAPSTTCLERAVRDWNALVRSRLHLTGLTPAREARIVRELAVQLEDFYRDGLARGLSESDADGEARRQISDWDRLAEDVRLADRLHAASRFDRLPPSRVGGAGPG